MKIKFHHILAFFILTLFFDFDILSVVRLRIIDFFLAGVVAYRIVSMKGFKFSSNAATMSFYFFVIYLSINGIIKVSLSDAIKEAIQLIEYIFLMHFIAEATDEPQKRKEFLNILFWGTGCIALYSMIFNVSQGDYVDYKELDSPKHSFAYFALLAVIRIFTTNKKKQFQYLITFVAIVMLLFSGERKGWAGFIIGTGMFVYLQIKSKFTKRNFNAITTFIMITVTIGSITVLFLTANPEFHYLDRQLSSFSDVTNFFSSGDSKYESKSDEERIFMLKYGMQLFVQYPLSGIGVDQFKEFVTKETSGLISHDAHNFYLKILVEDGIIGLIFFLLTLFFIFLELLKKTRNKFSHIQQDARIIMALFLLGSVVNAFLAAKALSWYYLILPCGMLLGINKELELYKKLIFKDK
jgi:O-antigen ligase